ncbi:ABC transporter substrate binding protein [Pleionea sp. CnH1-48]|uniref:ABC transporter substrate binding protein n=1 Tax=Pleionea sp. CnH1-48 TaxID=2954494 RepID=UPI0020981D11|nr:ABC transporter substrate binding protein [Pleionea sp. CnH1-48]MCO7223411.1 diguanylate cyclase [Pleionea sp. CnH1-48]
MPILLLISLSSFADNNQPTVLILNSYHPQYKWTDELTRGAIEVLSTKVPTENIHIEYMDNRRFADDQKHRALLLKLYHYTYKQFRPDVIITSDDAALHFIVEHGDDLFPDIPVVFLGINVFNESILKGKQNFTGVIEGVEIEGNLEFISQVQPNLKQIYLLGGTKDIALHMVKSAREIKKRWVQREDKKHIQLHIMDDFSLDEFGQKSSQMNQESAILVMAIYRDNTGRYFSYHHDLPILAAQSNAPVYGMWGADLIIGSGALGGMINNAHRHGGAAAQIALRIIDGEPVENIKIQPQLPFEPTLDYHQMQRFGIAEEHLPDNINLVNEPVSFYRKYTALVNIVVTSFVLLTVIIILLFINIGQRRKIQNNLRRFNDELEMMVQERTEELNQQKAEVEHLANHDQLTGLPSLRLALDRLNMAISSAKRNKDRVALLYLDLDGFKIVNDTHGHDAGDKVLQYVAYKMRSVIREMDTASRIGGDEFLIILTSMNERQELKSCCLRLIEEISSPMSYQNNALQVGVSIGVAVYPDDADSAIKLRKTADKLMYKVKRTGKNNFKLAP